MFNFHVTSGTQRNQVRQLVGLLVILVLTRHIAKVPKGLNVVHRKRTLTYLMFGPTVATSVIVALAYFPAHIMPVRPIVVLSTTAPQSMIFTDLYFRPIRTSALSIAEICRMALVKARTWARYLFAASSTGTRFCSDPHEEWAFLPNHILGAPSSRALQVTEQFVTPSNSAGVSCQWLPAICALNRTQLVSVRGRPLSFPSGMTLTIAEVVDCRVDFARTSQEFAATLSTYHLNTLVIISKRSYQCALMGGNALPTTEMIRVAFQLPRSAIQILAAAMTLNGNAILGNHQEPLITIDRCTCQGHVAANKAQDSPCQNVLHVPKHGYALDMTIIAHMCGFQEQHSAIVRGWL